MASGTGNRYNIAGCLRPFRGFELHQQHRIWFQEHAGSPLKRQHLLLGPADSFPVGVPELLQTCWFTLGLRGLR